VKVPHAPEAERSVLGQIMAGGPKVAGEVIGTLLEGQHFHDNAHRLVFDALVEAYYSDDPMDGISIGEKVAPKLSKIWGVGDDAAIARCREMAVGQRHTGSVVDHAQIVKREFDRRELLEVAGQTIRLVEEGEKTPEEIGGLMSADAMRIATDSLLTHDLVSFGDAGRKFVTDVAREKALVQQGVELGAYTGLDFIDHWTAGIRPTELVFSAGEPGVGKSSVWWTGALRFAERQMRNPDDRRVGCLILSLEMGQQPSAIRLAQTLTSLDGRAFREARFDESDLTKVKLEWGRRKDLPLYFNFASTLRASQIRALCVEAIRRFNVGLVIIDHFRYFDMDRVYDNPNKEDEDKVRFLKEGLAKDLNLAVVCIAHTVKAIDTPDGRPTKKHLRGSGQISADADFVSFVYRPYMYASERAKEQGDVRETDAEMIWDKNRHGTPGAAEFYMEPQTMTIRDLYSGGI
jgi:replicative DNA helicase